MRTSMRLGSRRQLSRFVLRFFSGQRRLAEILAFGAWERRRCRGGSAFGALSSSARNRLLEECRPAASASFLGHGGAALIDHRVCASRRKGDQYHEDSKNWRHETLVRTDLRRGVSAR